MRATATAPPLPNFLTVLAGEGGVRGSGIPAVDHGRALRQARVAGW